MPLSISCLNTANLALIGTPFLAGFYSKDAILELAAAGPCNSLICIILILATMLTALYSFRLSIMSLWGPRNSGTTHATLDTDTFITRPMIILTLGAILGGAAVGWVLLPSSLEPSLPGPLKLLPLVLSLSGLWLAILRTSSDAPLGAPFQTFHHRRNTIWFIAIISTQPLVAGPLQKGHRFLKHLDHGW